MKKLALDCIALLIVSPAVALYLTVTGAEKAFELTRRLCLWSLYRTDDMLFKKRQSDLEKESD